MSAELYAAGASFLLAAAGLAKTITADIKRKAEVKEIQDDRKVTHENYDAHLAIIDTRLNAHDESLKAGNDRFDKTDRKLDEMAQKTDAKLDKLGDKQEATSNSISELKGLILGLKNKETWG